MATPIPPNHALLSLAEIARATGGTVAAPFDSSLVLEGLTTDSRAVTPGSVFVALRGETHDGHAFLARAIESGAKAVIVESASSGVQRRDVAVVVVEDTLSAWGALGRAYLRAWRSVGSGRTVAITGSAGKTTTKELCAALLGQAGPCHATPGNLNNRVGVPAVALCIAPADRFAVFEVGMSLPGEIAKLAAIVEPDVAVLLNVGVAHAGGVGGSRADVAREKGALFEGLGAGAVAVVSADDEAALSQLSRAPAARVVRFGRAPVADYRLTQRAPLAEGGSRLVVEVGPATGGRRLSVDLPLPGEAAAVDFVAALAAAEATLGNELSEAAVMRAMSGLPKVSGRAAIRRLAPDIVVLDDTYNANPASMRAALDTLDELALPASRRTVAVLGEMKELGPLGELEHERLGDEIARHRVGLVIGCGGLIDLALDRAARAGVDVIKAHDTPEAAKVAAQEVRAGDAVLLKGSRGAGVERVWEALEHRSVASPSPGAGA